jgi:hypothetical protein
VAVFSTFGKRPAKKELELLAAVAAGIIPPTTVAVPVIFISGLLDH